MTSGNVANISPNIMVNTKGSAKDDVKAAGFIDVMKDSVARNDRDVKSNDNTVADKKVDDAKDTKTVDKSKDTSKTDKNDNTDNQVNKTDNKDKTSKSDETSKAEDKANLKTDTSKNQDVEAIANAAEPAAEVTDISQIPVEVIELVNEVINNFSSDVKDILIGALDITEEELSDIMTDLDITFADLLNPKQVTELMVEATGVEDSVSLVLNEDLSNALSSIRDLSEQVVSDTNLETNVIQNVVKESNKGVLIPQEMLNQAAEAVEVDEAVDITNVTKETVATDVKDEQIAFVSTRDASVKDVTKEESNVAVKSEPVKVSDNESTDKTANETSDNTFTVDKTSDPETKQSDNFRQNDRQQQDTPRTLNGENIVVNNQNVDASTPQVTEARPVITRFQTMQMISQISEAARINLSDEVTSLEMILNPESLGKIYLNVSQKQGALRAQIIAQNEAIKDALENQVNLLKENLNKSGIKVEAVEVSVGTHEFERNLEEGMHGQEEQARQQEEQASKMRKPISINLNNLDELQGLMSDEDMLVAQMMRDQGNSMNLQA